MDPLSAPLTRPAGSPLYAVGALIYRRRWVVLAAWAVLLLLAAPVAPRAIDALKPGGFSNDELPAVQARQLFQERLNRPTMSVELIFRSETASRAFDPQFDRQVLDSLEPLLDRPEVTSIRTHLDDAMRVSSDGRAIHASLGLNLNLEQSQAFLDVIEREVDPGELTMTVTGGPPLYRDIGLVSERDLRRAERLAFPLATLTLLLVFGTLVAAITPAAVGGAGVIAGLAVVAVLAQQVDMSVFVLNIVTLLGIGIGIDYSLFFTSRFREELAGGRGVGDAVAAAETTAGRAILFSGITSIAGLSSLLAFDFMMLRSVGLGAVIVITVALLAALTLLPALLGVLGGRVNWLRVLPERASTGYFWVGLSHRVMRRPLLFLVPAVIFLLALAIPVRDLQLGTVDGSILPLETESRRGFEMLQADFGLELRTEIPVGYTLPGDPLSADAVRELYAYGRALERIDGITRVTSIVNLTPAYGLDQYLLMYENPTSTTDGQALQLLEETVRNGFVLFVAEAPYHPFSPEARQLVAEVRALEPGVGRETHVSGGSADIKDVVDNMYSRFPIIIGIVLAVTYLSLLLLFRSVLLPLKALVLNALSILAAYGALVFVFQQGNFSGLLNFTALGTIEATTPILLFAIIFGLSMDYEIFLLSRVSEEYRRTGDNIHSVAMGLQRSGRIITGAAAILIVVAASFVTADIVTVKAIGLGLALAVLVDVTIVRALVAPAAMRLLGDWNWWLPGWLDRLLPGERVYSE